MKEQTAAALLAPAFTYEPLARALMYAIALASQKGAEDEALTDNLDQLFEIAEKLRMPAIIAKQAKR